MKNRKRPKLKEVSEASTSELAEAAPSDEGSTEAESAAPSPSDAVSGPVTFASLGVCEELCIACEALGWKTPTPIQVATIPPALEGRDIIGLAATGSGKTGAFALPVLQSLLDSVSSGGGHGGSPVFCLVLAPTRELSLQISQQFLALGAGIRIKVCTLIGGLDMVAQALELAKRPHVVIATPGRVVDHLENTKGFNLSSIKYLIMDEADRLLSMDFEEAIDRVLELVPRNRNTYLFSATMTSRVSKLQRTSLVKPVRIELSSKFDTADNLIQNMKLVEEAMKSVFYVALLGHLRSYSSITFVNRCDTCALMTATLRQLGFPAISLHGKMSQAHRLGALNAFRAGQKKALIATEVGSRGLDIPQVDIVINYDVPLTAKDYIHRVGRTARAGRCGRAITIVTQYDVESFVRIEESLKKKLEVYKDLPDDKWRQLADKVKEAYHLAKLEITTSEKAKRKQSSGDGSNRQRHGSKRLRKH